MIIQENTQNLQPVIKSALKKGFSDDNNLIFRRYDRRGKEIASGQKYEVTINDDIQRLAPLASNRSPRISKNSLIVSKSPVSKSPLMEKNETAPTPIQKKQSQIIVKKLELNREEEQALKILDENIQKNKKKGKQSKECCIIQ